MQIYRRPPSLTNSHIRTQFFDQSPCFAANKLQPEKRHMERAASASKREREREGDAVRQRGRGGGCYRSERPSELSRLRSGSYVASRQRRGRVKEEGKQNHLPEKDTWGEALLLPPASPCSIWMICRSVAAALISHCC